MEGGPTDEGAKPLPAGRSVDGDVAAAASPAARMSCGGAAGPRRADPALRGPFRRMGCEHVAPRPAATVCGGGAAAPSAPLYSSLRLTEVARQEGFLALLKPADEL